MMVAQRKQTKARMPLAHRLAAHCLRLRTEKRLTQTQLAALSGVKQKTISLVETASIEATQKTVEQLAEAFGVDPTELYREPTKRELAASA